MSKELLLADIQDIQEEINLCVARIKEIQKEMGEMQIIKVPQKQVDKGK